MTAEQLVDFLAGQSARLVESVKFAWVQEFRGALWFATFAIYAALELRRSESSWLWTLPAIATVVTVISAAHRWHAYRRKLAHAEAALEIAQDIRRAIYDKEQRP